MSIGIVTSVRNSRGDQIIAALDAGAGAGLIKIYTGTQPATGGALSGNTLLGTLTLSDPSGTMSNGVLTFDTVSDDVSADADGTITWARFTDSDSNTVFDVDCGVTGSGAALTFNAVTVTTGGVIQVTSASITEGGA